MRIKQGYLSNGLRRFNYVNEIGLEKLSNYNSPVVIFGIYERRDIQVLKKIKSKIVIFWGGSDAIMLDNETSKYISENENISNVTCMLNTVNVLENKNINCDIIPPIRRKCYKITPIELGDKIYSYIPTHNSKYYGIDIINKLDVNSDLLIGDLSISEKEWTNGKYLEYYSKCFIGLSLSKMSGGGRSIVEMGLCGLNVVNNITNFPNTLKWNNINDINNHINNQRLKIGSKNKELAEQVYEFLDNEFTWLNI
jgi:hypothetical protein